MGFTRIFRICWFRSPIFRNILNSIQNLLWAKNYKYAQKGGLKLKIGRRNLNFPEEDTEVRFPSGVRYVKEGPKGENITIPTWGEGGMG